jgi:hypothetical protein
MNDKCYVVQFRYVSGVRESHTEEMFKEYFTQYGAVEKVEIIFWHDFAFFYGHF